MNQPSKKQLYTIFHLIINQFKMQYNACNMFISFFKCLCLRKEQHLKRSKSQSQRLEYFYRKGEQKLERDLDVENLIHMIKGFRVMNQVLFNQNQQLFLKFQRQDQLLSETQDSSQEGLNTLNCKELLSNNLKDQARESAKTFIKENLKKFDNRGLSMKDFRVLQGVLSKDFKAMELKQIEQKELQAQKTIFRKEVS